MLQKLRSRFHHKIVFSEKAMMGDDEHDIACSPTASQAYRSSVQHRQQEHQGLNPGISPWASQMVPGG
jgi:hypothetical protein